MTNNRNYYTSSNYEDHTRFGGYVRYSDFDIYPSLEDQNGYHTMSNIAKRIEDDFKFDEQCRKNIENKSNRNNWRTNNENKELQTNHQ